MDLSRLAEIERCALALASAAKSLADYYSRQAPDTNADAHAHAHPRSASKSPSMDTSSGFLFVAPTAPETVHRARRVVLGNATKLQSLVRQPKEFLQQLANQTQLLACLHWLGEFQVLACIPLKGSVPVQDVAALTGVPESVLLRIVRMASTAGFLCEPPEHPRHVAHTSLSADFVTEPLLADAASFLAGTLAPAALNMAATTRRHGKPGGPEQSAFSLISQTQNSPVPLAFSVACEQQPRLQRQWAAYRRSSAETHESGVAEALSRLDWSGWSSACIVEALGPLHRNNRYTYEPCPSTMARHLAARYGSQVEITIQFLRGPPSDSSASHAQTVPSPPSPPLPGAILQNRSAGQPQNVRHAALYVLHWQDWAYLLPPPPSAGSNVGAALKSELTAELQAHLSIMRENRTATLVVAMRLLPDDVDNSVDRDTSVEAVARACDLALLQLANSAMLHVGDVVDLIQSVEGGGGRLVVVSRAKAGATNEVVALGVKFQPV
ncbi:O-methyltransferase bik3 [Dichotomopilus funicola]|uniref:O-methyltransferase bik3 n=1 Tax=Dichotomopilus funicola TaxID=1934379 RepID=A0AAN6UUL7_9PEZI|nr:O-methyltransferase bik3 [Dichotomopilus funicola]